MVENKVGQHNPFEDITRILNDNKISYRVIEHEPVFTSQRAEEISGLKPSQGAKALLLSTGESFVLAVLPGDKRVSFKKVAGILGIKKVRFASEGQVMDVMHCNLGACYPFGSVCKVRTIADLSFGNEGEIAFNPGVNDKSIIMNGADYRRVECPGIANIIEE